MGVAAFAEGGEAEVVQDLSVFASEQVRRAEMVGEQVLGVAGVAGGWLDLGYDAAADASRRRRAGVRRS
jgi:hypothetical protein